MSIVSNNPHQSVSQIIALESRKIWLRLEYLLAPPSCLHYFDRKKIFSGGVILGKTGNYGNIEYISEYAKATIPLKPYGSGVCLGAALHFARVWADHGRTVAAQRFTNGAPLEAVRLQAEYRANLPEANLKDIAFLKDVDRNMAQKAGLEVVAFPHSHVSAATVLESKPSTWADGIYKMSVPLYSRFGGEFMVFTILFFISLEVMGLGWGMQMNGVYLQHIMMGVTGLWLVCGLYSLRTLKYDGQHSVTFIKERGTSLLYDPNTATGTHNDADVLLKNLFENYMGDLNLRRVSVQHLRRQALPAA